MCELICSAWYPEKVSGYVPAMPVVEVMPQSHREREVLAPALAAASDADSEPEMPPEEYCETQERSAKLRASTVTR